MAMKPIKKSMVKTKVKAKPGGSDYMKPVGGTKQEGYVRPGGNLFDVKAERKKVGAYGSQKTKRTGLGVGEPKKTGMYGNSSYTKTGINPTAMKATSGNPKPTAVQLATAKKKAVAAKKNKTMETQAQKKKNTKPAMGSTKGATLKSPKPTPSPSTGRYKRGNP